MNKFLMMAIAAFALGTAIPAIAMDDAQMNEDYVETCVDADGAEIECPTADVEVDADVESDHEMHEDGMHDNDAEVEVEADVEVE